MPTEAELALPADGTVNWGSPMRGSVLVLNKAFEDYKATDTGGGGGTGDSALYEAMQNLARIDAVMTSLDTRESVPQNWAVAADSIGDAATEWAEKGVKDFAAVMAADRPAGFRRWNATNNTLGAYNQWQAGVGTGTIGTPGNYVILNDEFNRGGASTAIEASGATPDTGNGNWQGPTGRWRIYNNSVLEIVPGVTPVLTDVLYALTQPHDTDAINVNAQSLHRLSSNASSAVTTQTALMGAANKTGIYHEVILPAVQLLPILLSRRVPVAALSRSRLAECRLETLTTSRS
ncbi:hypothetical protein CMP1-22 [Clavibacter phage CMP1]|uniref:Uncharacterized protein n=1 Tax=Clavibacter phage CMP1 TaxID=686439 RepID=D0U206_9CAUD|nr:hypothetical protein CMP1-22 [Clavibacter phage CMP1]ACY35918.1 hypothetical protein CMP1-22 [Clavibacter phage CMP1]